MSKVITIEVPEWVDEERLKTILNKVLMELSPKVMPVDKLREMLGVVELEEEITDHTYVREKEKERIKWLY
ncbi:hypothetical protein [Pyrococcus abyssi]|uniref:Uncharacterized protein n=1 Tax=Pyrococcus abyssi (strain GE5 / Orsay) TaxID=272844 RepID=G8ZKI3_PYRAB|nr:hypothetical protein [Pyrococcus abyssi]CCE70626.1 TPA: hypothetical protein PAB1585.1n [Pyrococcus abyssi GE5]